MRAYERLLKYVTVHTASDEQFKTHPTSARQLDLARMLAGDMKDLGLRDVRISEYGYVYGVLPATHGYENRPKLGFIAHMDTSPDAPGDKVKPRVIEQYDGGEVALSGNNILTVERFPHLASLAGRTLITTDGTTLLGADDKAGIAEILTACELLIKEKSRTARSVSGLRRTKKSDKAPISLMCQALALILPIRWMADRRASWSSKISTPDRKSVV